MCVMRNCLVGVCSILVAGCASTKVVKNPDEDDTGIRYYRPKPYLMIKPSPIKDVEQKVDISITYLPDYSEEYSIHVNAGLGTNSTEVKLTNGWNLESVNIDVDSKAAELIGAVSQAATAAAGFKGRPATKTFAEGVSARDVPMGLYEAVTGIDDCGRKRLYGWRYVGFAPFAQCPTCASGGPYAQPCEDGLWGLVSDNGVLVFKRVSEIAAQGVKVAPREMPKQ